MINEEQNITLEEPKVQQHKEKAESKNTERILKIFSIILGILSVAALVWIKIVNPKFPLLYIILLGGFIILISGLTYFGFTIYRKFTEEKDTSKEYKGKLPRPASLASLRQIAEECLTNEHFCNHTTGCKNERYVHAGKNGERLYIYHTHALYDNDMEKGEVYIVINSHFPDDLKTVLIDPTSTLLTKSINSLASEREEIPEESIKSELEYSPLTGGYKQTTEESKKHKEEPKKEKKEDLK